MDAYITWVMICMEITFHVGEVFRQVDWFNEPMSNKTFYRIRFCLIAMYGPGPREENKPPPLIN